MRLSINRRNRKTAVVTTKRKTRKTRAYVVAQSFTLPWSLDISNRLNPALDLALSPVRACRRIQVAASKGHLRWRRNAQHRLLFESSFKLLADALNRGFRFGGSRVNNNENTTRNGLNFAAAVSLLTVCIDYGKSIRKSGSDVNCQKIAPTFGIHRSHVEFRSQPSGGWVGMRSILRSRCARSGAPARAGIEQ